MSESTKHPSRLWIVDTDEHAGFVVREVDVVPVHPEQPPVRWAQYRITDKPEWLGTVLLDFDAYRTEVEALKRAVGQADDAVYEWEQKAEALREQLARTEEEEAAEAAEKKADTAAADDEAAMVAADDEEEQGR